MTEIATPPKIDIVKQAKIDLAACFRAAALHGFNEGIDNHFRLAVPGRDDRFLLNRYGPHWSELRASRHPHDRTSTATSSRATGEWDATAFMIHRGAHRARARRALRAAHAHAVRDGALADRGRVRSPRSARTRCTSTATSARLDYGGLATAEDEGTRIGEAIGDDVTVVILENHGVLVVGTDVADAWHKLYFLERACQVQVLAQSTGRPLMRVQRRGGDADRLAVGARCRRRAVALRGDEAPPRPREPRLPALSWPTGV